MTIKISRFLTGAKTERAIYVNAQKLQRLNMKSCDGLDSQNEIRFLGQCAGTGPTLVVKNKDQDEEAVRRGREKRTQKRLVVSRLKMAAGYNT